MNAENNDTAIKRYLLEIGRIPLLTPQQEIELAAKISARICARTRSMTRCVLGWRNLDVPIG